MQIYANLCEFPLTMNTANTNLVPTPETEQHHHDHSDHYVRTHDGLDLFVRDVGLPLLEKAKLGVVIMHGLSEHSGRYAHVVDFFVERGFAVRCYDHRGHGKSQGPRGDLVLADDLIRDAHHVITDFSQHLSSPPLVFAHSMGGLFATHLALLKQTSLSGLVLSSPAYQVPLNAGQRLLFKVCQRLFPSLAVTHGNGGIFLSHDLTAVKQFQDDPLIHHVISARLFGSMLSSMEFVREHAHEWNAKMLLQVAGADLVVKPQAALDFYAQQTSNCVQMKVYDDFYHEIYNELDKARAFQDLHDWLIQEDFIHS